MLRFDFLSARWEAFDFVDYPCDPGWAWEYTGGGRDDFHLWYVYRGGALVETGGEIYTLRPGDMFLFDYARSHHASHDPRNPLGVYTLHFRLSPREKLAGLIAAGGLYPQKTAGREEFFREIFTRLFALNLLAGGAAERRVWAAAVLTAFFDEQGEEEGNASGVEKLCAAIQESPEKFTTLEQMCAIANYSPNQLIRLFRQAKGMPPYRYCLQVKMARARQQLLCSNYSVSQIAERLGYHDTAYFSRQYKQITGEYPTACRRRGR